MDIRPLLLDPFLSGWMHQRIVENVALIVTIPERAHEGLRKRIIEAFQEAPFDQQALQKLVRDEFKSSGLQPEAHCAGPNEQADRAS